LVIDTVVCLTLDKWETVTGQFGGYLTVSAWTAEQGEDRIAPSSILLFDNASRHNNRVIRMIYG